MTSVLQLGYDNSEVKLPNQHNNKIWIFQVFCYFSRIFLFYDFLCLFLQIKGVARVRI
jgi:hypothetical protein